MPKAKEIPLMCVSDMADYIEQAHVMADYPHPRLFGMEVVPVNPEFPNGAKHNRTFETHLPFIYPVIGLCGETGELFAKIGLYEPNRTDAFAAGAKRELFIMIHKEMGDVLWYLTEVAWTFDIQMERVVTRHTQHQGICIDGNPNDIRHYSCEIAELTKKILRDNLGEPDKNHRHMIEQHLAHILYHLSYYAVKFETTIQAIADLNISKLKDRKARGVMQGSGDSR